MRRSIGDWGRINYGSPMTTLAPYICAMPPTSFSCPSNRQHLSCDECLKDQRKDYRSIFTCAVLCTTLTVLSHEQLLQVNYRIRVCLITYWDGWPCPGLIPGAGHLFRLRNQPATHANSAFRGSVNEYQLRLGRKRQVWFILLADERPVCR